MTNPFTVLGLPVSPDLTDGDVRLAFLVRAAETHPDRTDGGDPAAFAAASAAYRALRTPWQRSEAYADIIATAIPAIPLGTTPAPAPVAAWRALSMIPARLRHGRPGILLLRITAATLLAWQAIWSGAGQPADAGVITGLVTWVILTGRHDLAPPAGR